MTPQQVWPGHGLPCDRCGRPVHVIEIYPNGRRIVHQDRGLKPCDVPNTIDTPRTS